MLFKLLLCIFYFLSVSKQCLAQAIVHKILCFTEKSMKELHTLPDVIKKNIYISYYFTCYIVSFSHIILYLYLLLFN